MKLGRNYDVEGFKKHTFIQTQSGELQWMGLHSRVLYLPAKIRDFVSALPTTSFFFPSEQVYILMH